ncbi:MAG: hypothetical protein JO189_24525 [Deltaproteobacteria bacterium]|nr:hypothetical protein [Deltaproteobacteria bacterium]
MEQKHSNSIVENDESLEAPTPRLIAHRKKFDDFEPDFTGGHHIGHLPVYVVAIEDWTFRRCRCGFSLALTPGGAIWWLRTTKDSMEIKNFKALLRALNSNCWAHPRPELLKKNMVISPPAVMEISAESLAPVAVESANSSAPPPASLGTPSKAKVKDQVLPVAQTEKPPPVKRRRTYIPVDTTRTTRSRPNPIGR